MLEPSRAEQRSPRPAAGCSFGSSDLEETAGQQRPGREKLLVFGSGPSIRDGDREAPGPLPAPHARALCKRQREGEGQGAPRTMKPPSPQNTVFLQGWEMGQGQAQAGEQLQRFTPPSTAVSCGTLTFSGQGCDDGQGQEGLQGGHFQQCAARGA